MEKCWNLIHYCVLMHRGILLFLHDSSDTYATRQRNVHYVCHNAAVTIATPNGCPTSTTTKECSPEKKMAQEVCESTSRFTLARVDGV